MSTETRPIYTHTGHPLVDVGASVIAAFNRRRNVEEVTEQDLVEIVQYITQHYFREPLRGFLTTVFPNSAYANPTMGEERKRDIVADVLSTSPLPAAEGPERCPFCGQAAKRRFRQHVPLVTGEGAVNFTPGGQAGLPVCARCLVAIQACVLGTLKCQGRLLLAHSDDPELTLRIVAGFLAKNQRILSIPSSGKYPESKYPGTILMEALMNAQTGQEAIRSRPSLTAYHLTNYGTSANVDVYHLPSEVLAFVSAAQASSPVRDGWQYAVRQGWRLGLPPAKGKPADEPTEYKVGEHRNQLYEDLFGLTKDLASLGRFIRRHLSWRIPDALARAPDGPPGPDAWPLTEVFLRMVLLMEKARVEVLRTLGERFAGYVVEQNDKRFFDRLWRESGRYHLLRSHLLRASHAQVKRGEAPLISFDEFLLAFEDGEEVARADWSLARDLLLIRMMDELHARGWLQEHAAELADAPDEATESED
ncbi:MAG: type I-B CRISPR-associated protein Cas8b1/Cst1 [Armatimonadetes bacterium]|nr:type I-B CRISPR-associated protein Cas8b1/Cst1 [Armatimonadota bacterium]